MKRGSMLINTARGALIDTRAAIDALKTRDHLSYLGIDAYEEEGALFFTDRSSTIIQDDVFERLTTLPNVVITGHQSFLTREALTHIAETTLVNISDFQLGQQKSDNLVTVTANRPTKADARRSLARRRQSASRGCCHGSKLTAWTIGSCEGSPQRILETTGSNGSDPRSLLRRRSLRAVGLL
jgi:hypothetical protein